MLPLLSLDLWSMLLLNDFLILTAILFTVCKRGRQDQTHPPKSLSQGIVYYG